MSSGLSNLLFIGVMFAVFWFLVMRPQQQRARQQREMLDALEAGDEVVTIGGIFGTVVNVGDRVLVRVADGSEMEVAKTAIAQVVESGGSAGDATDHGPEEDLSTDA